MKHRVCARKNWRNVVLLFCIMALSFAQPSSVYGEGAKKTQTERRTVRVAFPSQEGMSGVGESGDLTGYNYEYLQELAEYAGWNLEYITYEGMSGNEGISNAMQMVMSGEADLLGPILKNEAVEEMFDFPKDNYGVVYTTLCALEKSDITSVSYSKITPLRVAIYATADTRNQEVKDYLDQQGIVYELIPCETTEEQLDMLNEGKADVLSSITLSYFDGTRSVAEFAPRPYYLVTTKGNSELLSELDKATQILNYTRPYLQQQLQEEYFGDTSSGYVLTDSEQKYMEELETLNVLCASSEDAPYVLKNKDGEPAGMMVSVLNDFAEKNNIQVQYTFCDSPLLSEEEWKTGAYDCVIGIPLSSKYCSQNDIVRTEAITSVDLVLIAKQQTTKPLKDSVVAVYSRRADQINEEEYGSVIQMDDPQQCYEAVENGEADYGCADRLSTEYALFERHSALVTTPLMGRQEDICIGVTRSMGEEFLSALNKYIHTLSDGTKTTFLSEGSRHVASTGLKTVIREHPLGAALVVSGIVILLVSLVMFAVYASRSKKKNLELQKANSAKSDFLARMSHDIRTPMNAIVGYLGIARDTEGCPQKVEHCLENSEVAAKHLLQLINDVLDMSSIESGKMKIAQEEFNLKREVLDVTTVFYQNSKAKGIRFETQVRGVTEEWIQGDQLRMNQIVMNLLSNAVKFTPEGGMVRLLVEQSNVSEAGSDMKITVSDTGIGMSEEYMTHIFQPFEQESANTALQYGGSGLGLSIVHNLVAMMGGTISVESRQKEGTTFTVCLHFAKAVKHKQEKLSLPENLKMRVLLVSDAKEKAENVQDGLKVLGIKSDIVTDGAYAVKRISRRQSSDYPYSLCILDWNELDTDGGEMVKAIRREANSKQLALTAVGYDLTEFEEKARAAGIDSLVRIPLFLSDLAELVKFAVGESDSTDFRKKPVQMNLSGKRMLLAEDNAMNMEIAVTVLQKSGVQIEQAVNGEMAVDLFEKSPAGTYDFILMDVQMPVMNGYEATKKIRESVKKDAKTVPIIAMTANAFAEDVAAALASGMNAHISKPVNFDKLFEVLGEFIFKEV